MKFNKYTSFLLGFFLLNIIYWIGIQTSNIKTLPINLLFSFSTAVLAFVGGVMGLFVSRHWGGRKSAVGKAIQLMSIGTISWSLGNFVWSYYTFFLHTDIPYPSLADVGYISAVPLWMIGVFYLSKATGAKYSLKKKSGQFYLIILPIITFVISYYLLVTVARGGQITSGGGFLKTFFDFAYPLGDVIIITIALLMYGLSFRYLGGNYKWPVLITLIGYLVMFSADFTFSYTTTIGTYYNGSYPDMLFAAAMFVISFGINSFDAKDL
jgi:hypothetical protein